MEAGQRKVASPEASVLRYRNGNLGQVGYQADYGGRTEVRRLRKPLSGGCGWVVRQKSKEHRLKSVPQKSKAPGEGKVKDRTHKSKGCGTGIHNRICNETEARICGI